jgi:hypothetical protein
MQKKTIAKNIKSKISAWISTLPKELQKDVEKNTLVTGGCIASMFLNKPVNDYDVYLMDMDVLKRLAEYYCRPFVLHVADGRNRANYLSGYSETVWIEGNEVENLSKDKVFFESLKEAQVKIKTSGSGFAVPDVVDDGTGKFLPVFISPNAISLTDNLQVVVRFNGNAEQIHKTFDFVHATNYWTKETGLVLNIDALESILTKQLRYQGSLYPLTTIIRIKKFLKRGWNITAGEQLKVMFQISEFDLKNPRVLEEQLIGVDIAYFGALIEALEGVKKDEISSTYINTLIDKIFNESSDDV